MTKDTRAKDTAFKHWFDERAAATLGAQIERAARKFDRYEFERVATEHLDRLEFAARVRQFSDALRATLPDDVPTALDVLTRSLPPPLPDCEAVSDGWLQWPIGQFIADHGVPYFEPAMHAMIELTQRFSAEFAVRPFLAQRQAETLARLRSLTDHPSPHVRRWCSEGVRPRLPWGTRLRTIDADPKLILPILEALRDDPERYVQRSVANSLGDVLKRHPDVVLTLCERWARGRAPASRRWTIEHAIRTAIKAGEPRALALVGFEPPRKIRARLQVTPSRIQIGAGVDLTAEITTIAATPQPILVDYVVRFARADDRQAEKVFKWTRTELAARKSTRLTKRHVMRETTIRRLYPGPHRIDLQINGHRVASAEFTLVPGP